MHMEIKSYFEKWMKRKDESGYAMILTLGIVILTVGILSSMTLLTVTDVKNSNRNRGVLEARIASESSLDSLYSAINVSGNKDDIGVALNSFVVLGTNIKIVNTTTVTGQTSISEPGLKIDRYEYQWSGFNYAVDKDGVIVSCPPDRKIPCFKIRLIKVVSTPDYADVNSASVKDSALSLATRQEFIIDIVTRTKCDTGTTNNCSYSRVQQNLSLRKYVEYASISEKEDVAPVVLAKSTIAGTPAINGTYSLTNYYSGQDRVVGNIHTNSSSIKSCNNFNSTISNWITASGTSGNTATEGIYAGLSVCNTGPASGATQPKQAKRAALALPDRVADSTANGLREIAKNDNAAFYVLSGAPDIFFNSDGFLVNGTTQRKMPSNGVLFLEDGGSISGTVTGRITIVSKPQDGATPGKDITIKGNLRYNDPAKDMIGVYSGKDIIIPCGSVTGRCTPIYVDGFLKANTDTSTPASLGTIYNPSWALSSTGGNAPEFELFGAMESYYRGTFGSIDSQSDQVKTGFKKVFTYDARLLYQQPPFMLRDGSIPFIRAAVKDVDCTEGSINVCTQ